MRPSLGITRLQSWEDVNGKYHPMVYNHYPLPGDVDVPRYKSIGHHTSGFVFKEEALTECDRMESSLIDEGYTVGKCLDEVFEWGGEETPASITLFVERDGKYFC